VKSGKNANCLLILNPDWTIQEDRKQTHVILTTKMRVEKRVLYRLDRMEEEFDHDFEYFEAAEVHQDRAVVRKGVVRSFLSVRMR
jgi:hypothetical protein